MNQVQSLIEVSYISLSPVENTKGGSVRLTNVMLYIIDGVMSIL